VKRVTPESIFTVPRGQVDCRSWDAAIDVVEERLLGMAAGDSVTDEDDRVLTTVFMECEKLRAKKYLEVVQTNHDLAKKYSVAPRTITNWRKEGCPFENGQWAVLDWLAERRYAPAGAKVKFAKQLRERKEKAIWAGFNAEYEALIADARRLKAAHQDNGLKIPDWLRGFRAKR